MGIGSMDDLEARESTFSSIADFLILPEDMI